jgi:hypothetical protein
MTCPKCGFEQVEGPECGRCGIVIAKYLERLILIQNPIPAIKRAVDSLACHIKDSHVFFVPDIPDDLLKEGWPIYAHEGLPDAEEEVLMLGYDRLMKTLPPSTLILTTKGISLTSGNKSADYDYAEIGEITLGGLLGDALYIDGQRFTFGFLVGLKADERNLMKKMLQSIVKIARAAKQNGRWKVRVTPGAHSVESGPDLIEVFDSSPVSDNVTIKRRGYKGWMILVVPLVFILSIILILHLIEVSHGKEDSKYYSIVKDILPILNEDEHRHLNPDHKAQILTQRKCFVWDMNRNSHYRTLTDLLHFDATDEKYAAILIKTRKEVVGYYTPDGQPVFAPNSRPAERIYLDVTIVYWPEKAVGAKYTTTLFEPPKRISIDPKTQFSFNALPPEARRNREDLLVKWMEAFKWEEITTVVNDRRAQKWIARTQGEEALKAYKRDVLDERAHSKQKLDD